MRKKEWLAFLLFLNVFSFGYGLWFKGFAWDEEQFYAGGRLVGKFFYSLFQGEPRVDDGIVSIYGLVGKYVSFFAMFLYEPIAMLKGYSHHEVMIFIRLLTSLLPALLAVILLYKMVSRHVGEEAGFCILLMSAFAFRWVEQSHYAVPDSLVTLFVVWSFVFMLKSSYHFRDLFWWALVLALAFHTKINVGLMLTVFSVVVLLVRWVRRDVDMSGKALLLLGFFWLGLTVLFGLPYLIHFQAFWKVLVFHIKDYPFVVKGSPWVYFYFKPALGIDWGLIVLALVGVVMLMRKYNAFVFLHFAWFVIFFSYLAFSRGAIPRWEVPLIPSLLVLGTYGLREILCLIGSNKKWVLAGVLFVVVARPAYHVCMFDVGLVHTRKFTLEPFYEKYGCHRVYYNFSFEYPSLKAFVHDSCNCAVLYEPYWNDLQTNGIPARFEIPSNNASFIGKPGDSIRTYIRQHWKIGYSYTPNFFTSWTFNPAAPKKMEFYIRSK